MYELKRCAGDFPDSEKIVGGMLRITLDNDYAISPIDPLDPNIDIAHVLEIATITGNRFPQQSAAIWKFVAEGIRAGFGYAKARPTP